MRFALKRSEKSDVITASAGSQELDAIRQNIGYIEFTPEGRILDVNDLFLAVVGFTRDEVIGQHHRMFCRPDFVGSDEYRNFWHHLASGQSHGGSFERVNRQGEVCWLQACYFPVMNSEGEVTKVIKLASDITAERQALNDRESRISALDRSLAVIEFEPDGTIISANKNFLQVMGYTLDEIQGQHHRLFCDDSFYREIPDFWKSSHQANFSRGSLNAGIVQVMPSGWKPPTTRSLIAMARLFG